MGLRSLLRTPREAASGADFVISSLMDDEVVLAIANGTNGLLAGLRPAAIHIGTSTISPALSAKLEWLHLKSKTNYVAGPVLGCPSAAEAGRLMTFLAGVPECIERKPVGELPSSPVANAWSTVLMLANEGLKTSP